MEEDRSIILGIGNPLWADEGTGVRLVEALGRRFEINGAELVDGGTQGIYLLPVVTESSRLLLFDAVKLGHAPGSVVVLENEAVDSAFIGRPLSLHQTSLRDLLASAKLVGWQPKHVVLIGIEAEDTENWGGDLSSVVAAAVDEALAQAEKIIREWGISITRRTEV